MARSPSPEEAFAEVLRALRTKRGFSQEALAHACGRHRTYISLLERAKHSPSLGLLFTLATALEVKPSEILRQVEAKLR